MDDRNCSCGRKRYAC
ncbi:hypothetical protein D4R42_03840 [bacterium]|nr:MAG: hypothetical protein D4R42_03840 [bacterium]